MSEQGILDAVRQRGSNAHDLRDAAHEATHGLELILPRWDRRIVDRALMRMRPDVRMRHEVTARAVEAVVCDRFGEEHSVDHFAMVTAIEALKAGVSFDAGAFAEAVRSAMTHPRVMDLAERVCALGMGDE